MGVRHVYSEMQICRDTATNWNKNNPVLLDGELGYDTTNKQLKVGDGVTDWRNLKSIVPDEATNESLGVMYSEDDASGYYTAGRKYAKIIKRESNVISPNLNNYITPGTYMFFSIGGAPVNFPTGTWTSSPANCVQLEIRLFYRNGAVIGLHQILFQCGSNDIWVRYCSGVPTTSSSWASWKNICGLASQTESGLMSSEDKTKIDKLITNRSGDKYLADDGDYKALNLVSTSENGLMSISDKNKVDKLVSNGDGSKYLADDGNYKTLNKENTTTVTTTEAGLMSPADKIKVDKIVTDGDGSKYLVDNGNYKALNIVSTSENGLMSISDKNKVDKLITNGDGSKYLSNDGNYRTLYGATTSESGLMSSNDKLKVDKLITNGDGKKYLSNDGDYKSLNGATTNESGLMSSSDKGKVDKLITSGDGNKYLADDGTYKTLNSTSPTLTDSDNSFSKVYIETSTSTTIRTILIPEVESYSQIVGNVIYIQAGLYGSIAQCNLQINNLGFKPIYFGNSLGILSATPPNNYWVATNDVYGVIYDGTKFICLNPKIIPSQEIVTLFEGCDTIRSRADVGIKNSAYSFCAESGLYEITINIFALAGFNANVTFIEYIDTNLVFGSGCEISKYINTDYTSTLFGCPFLLTLHINNGFIYLDNLKDGWGGILEEGQFDAWYRVRYLGG